jgi:uncharacterized membrane protein SirB2
VQAKAAHAARDLVMATVIYAFIPVLLATERPLRLRVLFYGASTVLILLIVTAQLYLGAQWYSLALFCVVIALAWVALLSLGYRRHRPDAIRARSFLLPIAVVFIAAAGMQWSRPFPVTPREAEPAMMIGDQEWQHGIRHRHLPAQRQDIAGRPKQPLNLQWAGALDVITARLHESGWQDVTPVSPLSTLRWLTSSTPIEQLPVLRQVHAGVHQALAVRLPLDHDHQYLLRLWPSGVRLASGEPVWIGSVSIQQAQSFYKLLRYPVTLPDDPPIEQLLSTIGGTERFHNGAVWLLESTAAAAPP